MKIAIACHPTYGGSGVVASELGMALAERGHEVHFISYQAPFRVNRLHENVQFHEVEVTSYPLFRYPPYALALATKLLEVVRSHGVRVLHVHYAIPHAISAVLTRQMCGDCGIRVITTLHGTDITLVGSDHSFHEITKYGIETSDGVTAVSRYLAEETTRSLGVTRDIRVIPNFIDLDVYSPGRRRPELRRRYANDDERLLVHISNFRPVKRVLDAVRVFHRVAEKMPARMLFVGTGPDCSAAEDEVEKLGLKDRVTFTGAVDGVHELLACSDLMLLPSEVESFGLAALEAMACGVPVVSTRTGGLPEVVEHGVSGYLGDVGDVAGQAGAALEILADGAGYARMAEAARERAEALFPLPDIVCRYEGYYREILDRP